MSLTKLCAERIDVGGVQLLVKEGLTKAEAKVLVQEMALRLGGHCVTAYDMVEAGRWPEGYEAIFVDEEGTRWFLADDWEVYDSDIDLAAVPSEADCWEFWLDAKDYPCLVAALNVLQNDSDCLISGNIMGKWADQFKQIEVALAELSQKPDQDQFTELETFVIGEVSEQRALIKRFPNLKPAHKFLNDIFES